MTIPLSAYTESGLSVQNAAVRHTLLLATATPKSRGGALTVMFGYQTTPNSRTTNPVPLLPSRMSVTSAAHHVQVIIDLLENAADAAWTPATTPTVKRYWDDAQSERGPGAGQPAILYVWSPTGSTLDRFSRDGDHFRRGDTVEVQAWSLDETGTEQLQRDVTAILSRYLDDNETQTPYTDVAPVGAEDFREQKPARTTDHYVMSVEVETDGLQRTDKDLSEQGALDLSFDAGFA